LEEKKMNNLIVFAHPNRNETSFNAAIKNIIKDTLLKRGEEVTVRNVYEMNFDPVLTEEDLQRTFQGEYREDIKKEQGYIAWADHLYFVYPTWWYSMPAILKGYIDRVFSSGFAFQYTKNGPVGLLNGKKAVVFQTAADPIEALQERNLITAMEACVGTGILEYCGLEVIEHKIFHSVHHAGDEARKQYLLEVEKAVHKTASFDISTKKKYK
jgi:NAD(P)H dehydrogenase (quinone)